MGKFSISAFFIVSSLALLLKASTEAEFCNIVRKTAQIFRRPETEGTHCAAEIRNGSRLFISILFCLVQYERV